MTVISNPSILTEASYQFMNRPSDERFCSLTDLHAFTSKQHAASQQKNVSSRKINFAPTSDNKGIVIAGKESEANPTHWSFTQLSSLAGVPASLLRSQCEAGLAPLATDNLNAGMKVIRDVEEVGIMIRREEDIPSPQSITLAAATGPKYGRVWNSQVTAALTKRFGNGVNDTDWTVPGFFGVPLDSITKENTTLFASDRDMFVFLADEKNRITLPNRRNGKQGSLARGFFIWNSEVGSKSLGIAFFLFDYSCCNRIVWGVQEYQRIALRHTVTAPDRWIDELHPVLISYGNASSSPIEARLIAAQNTKLDKAEEFLANRFGPRQAKQMLTTFEIDEQKPVETMWDAVTCVTGFAKTIEHTDTRVEMERQGGALLDLAKVSTNNQVLREMF